MYRNPLNNGNLSDTNNLKNQRNYGEMINKIKKTNLKTKPTELQKYNEYLTYKQPILDELNYVAERMRNEDIQKQKDDFEFIQKLKNQRQTQTQTPTVAADLSEPPAASAEIRTETFDDITPVVVPPTETKKEEIRSETFDDITPTITTNYELVKDDDNKTILSLEDTVIQEEKFELSREEKKETKTDLITKIKNSLGDKITKTALKKMNKETLLSTYGYLFDTNVNTKPSEERLKEIREMTPLSDLSTSTKPKKGRPKKDTNIAPSEERLKEIREMTPLSDLSTSTKPKKGRPKKK